MSRCKKHPTDLTSTVGVCASCLRERLFVIIAAQAQAQAQKQSQLLLLQQQSSEHLNFPRSVSPYIARRKSDASATWQQLKDLNNNNNGINHQRFYSTPQVGSLTLETGERNKKTRLSSLFSSIFRSKTDPPGSESRSWFSSLFSTRRRKKKHNRTFSLDEGSAARVPTRLSNNRGMSPVGCSSDDEDKEDGDGSSGESSESSSWKQRRENTPANASAARRRTTASSNSLNVSSGLAFCLSPLVRASPNHRNWSQEMGTVGESRVPPHLSNATSFCKNRSRKLADFGRYNSYGGKCKR